MMKVGDIVIWKDPQDNMPGHVRLIVGFHPGNTKHKAYCDVLFGEEIRRYDWEILNKFFMVLK